MQPFDHLAHWADASPSAVFSHDLTSSITYAEALRHTTGIAARLRDLGVRPGDTVSLELPVSLHLLFFQAVFHEAAISCAQQPELGAQRQSFVADWLFSTARTESARARRTVVVDAAFLRVAAEPTVGLEPRRYAAPTELCRLVFSSGTTGHPKAVAFTVEMIEHRARSAAGFWMHTPPFMSLLDIGTVSGFQTFYASVMQGHTYLIPGDGEHNAEMMERHGVASIKASPAQIAALTNAIVRRGEAPHALRLIQFAGAILPAETARAARAATGAVIHNLYGSTETGTVARRAQDSDDPYDAGFVTPGSAVEIVDDDHRPLPPGEVGMVRYRRELQATGYHRDPEATAAAFRDGWFYPGDLGSLDAHGRLRLAGRASEIVNSGGVKVDPAIVDACAVTVDGVREAGAFAHIGSDGLTQLVLAVVADEAFDATVLTSVLTATFGTARPSAVLKVDEIPRNGMGKVIRHELDRRHGPALDVT